MQKGQTLIFLLVGILVIAVAGGAYYLGRFSQNFSPTQKTCTKDARICPNGISVGRSGPNCEFTPCPSTSPNPSDETADWRTYTNTQYGFSIKYPQSWSQYIDSNWNFADLSPDVNTGTPGGGRLSGVRIGVDDPQGDPTHSFNKDRLNAFDLLKKQAIDPSDVHYETLNSIQIARSNRGIPGAGNGGPSVYIQKDRIIIEISGESLDEKTFNQILATFKFL